MTSASILVVVLTAAVVGAVVGLALGGVISNEVVLALVAGFLGTMAASVVRNTLVHRFSGMGPDDSRMPNVVLTFAVIASIAGSLAGHDIATLLGEASPVWIGTLAGLFSSVLMSLLMITYYMNPAPAKKKR
ncbi:MAG: hypothetical protein MUO41_10615 [Methyloceanibacter sp.]|nr:hypothetical protein [Methyloceanibacter sp.]